jgi:hypothetical protein
VTVSFFHRACARFSIGAGKRERLSIPLVAFVPVLHIPNRPRRRRRPRRRLVIEDRSGPRGWKKREGKEASGGSFAGTTGKQPRTTTTTRTIGGGMIKGRSLFLGQDGSDCYVCEVPYILGCFCRFAVETYTGRSLRRVSR